MNTYRATARRDGRFWLVDVDGVGVTQGRNLQDARDMAADLVETMTGAVGQIDFTVDLPKPLQQGLLTARDTMRSAEQSLQVAAEQVRKLAADLQTKERLTGKDVAFVLGVSEQRVSQLLKGTKSSSQSPSQSPLTKAQPKSASAKNKKLSKAS